MKVLHFAICLIAITALSTTVATAKCQPSHSGYSYDQRYKWPKLYPTCNGKSQSPVNIDVNSVSVKRVKFASPLYLKDYEKRIWNAKIENEGTTVAVIINTVNIHVTGGPAQRNKYRLESLHVHFGKHNGEGSEHNINGQPYSMEIHLVHRNSKYSSMETASRKKDGILVLALLVAVDKKIRDNSGLTFLTDNLRKVKDPRRTNSTVAPSFHLSTLLPNKGNSESYFTYFGSLTTPMCNEAVTWVVLKQITLISKSQMKQFRLLLDNCGKPIENNFRPLQALNQRIIGFVR